MEQIYGILIYAMFGTTIGAFGPIYLKKALKTLRFNFSLFKNKYLWLGLIFYLFSTVLFLAVLRFVELSVLYPFVALIYIWVSLLSVKMLKEKMNRFKWAGIVSIIIGVIFIGLGA